jgi:hypothetical protein
MIRTFVFSLLAVTGMSVALADTTTSASIASTISLAPIGLGAAETLEVNVANVASNSSSGTAASCTGSVTFFNTSGTAIGAAHTFTVTSGQTSAIQLPFSSSGGTGTRTTVRAVVSVTIPTTTPRPPCTLDVSLAIFETNTGTTAAVISGFQSLGVLFAGGLDVDVQGRGH